MTQARKGNASPFSHVLAGPAPYDTAASLRSRGANSDQRKNTIEPELRRGVVSGFAHPVRNVAALGISPGMKVADFGSGSGAYVLAIAKELHHSGHVYAIDIQKDLLRRTHNEAAKLGFSNVEIIWGDLEAPGGSKIADNSLELVLISNLLFQIEDKRAVMAEAKRILRPNGRLAVIDWSDSFGGMGPHKDNVVKKEDVLTLARAVEITFVTEFAAGAHHYGLIFRKQSKIRP